MTVITGGPLLDSAGEPTNGRLFLEQTARFETATGFVTQARYVARVVNGQILKAGSDDPLDIPPTPDTQALRIYEELGGVKLLTRTVAVPDEATVTYAQLQDVVPPAQSGSFVVPDWVAGMLAAKDDAVQSASLAASAEATAVNAAVDAENSRAAAVVAQQAAEAVPAQVATAMDAVLADPTSAPSTRLLTTFAMAEKPRMLGLLTDTLNRSSKYILTTYLPTAFPGTATIPSFGGLAESNIRPPSSAALGVSQLIDSGTYDPNVTGTSLADARAQVIRLATSVAALHRANAGTGWGGGWQDALWAYQAGAAGWLQWAYMDATQQGLVRTMVEDEANRLKVWPIHYWKDTSGATLTDGDSGSEEVAWNAAVVLLAMVMSPTSAQYASWFNLLAKFALAQNAIPADLADVSRVNGYVPANVLGGTNINPDGSVVNHSIIHPDYMVSAAISLYGALAIAARSGSVVPAAVGRHADLLYRALTNNIYTPPTYAAPGGSIYPWPATAEFYFPQGNDWGTQTIADKATFDVLASSFGWDRGTAPGAGFWAALHLGHQKTLMDRFTTGQTYPADNFFEDSYGEPSNYPREAWVAIHLGHALTALLHGPATVSYRGLQWAGAVKPLAPKLWFEMEGSVASTFADSSGFNRSGVLVGSGRVVRTPGLVLSDPASTATDFGGAGAAKVNYASWMDGAYSVACVYQRATTPTVQETIVARAGVGGAETGTRAFSVAATATSGFAKATVFSTTGTGTDLISSVNIADGLPHLLVLTVSSTTAFLYVDGVQAATASVAAKLDTAMRLTVAARLVNDVVTDGTAARIDEVLYFGGVLTGAQVTALNTALRNPA